MSPVPAVDDESSRAAADPENKPNPMEARMSSRVLSTEQAKSSISKMQSIINGGFADQIRLYECNAIVSEYV